MTNGNICKFTLLICFLCLCVLFFVSECHKYCLCLCVWDTLCDIYLNCFWGWLMVVHWILLMNYLGCLCINSFFVKALWLYLSIQFLDFDMNLCVLLARCLCCLFLNVTSIVCVYVCGIKDEIGFHRNNQWHFASNGLKYTFDWHNFLTQCV